MLSDVRRRQRASEVPGEEPGRAHPDVFGRKCQAVSGPDLSADLNRVELIWWNSKHGLQKDMRQHLPQITAGHERPPGLALASEELPLNVREAATYLGVSVQTVYLWVERKQIPHLRVMGRNIRFLKSDLEPFRATFKREVGIGKTDNA